MTRDANNTGSRFGRRLRALLKIRAGEGVKVFQFAALAALLDAGLAVGISTADSLFVTHLGAAKLPVIYLMTPVMMLVYIPICAYVMGRFGIDRLFNITLGVLTAGGIALFALISGNGASAPIFFYVAKLYATLWFIALYSLFWNFVDTYFDILDAKRLFAFFSGGAAFGAMAGGALVAVVVRFVPVDRLFLVWSVLAAATVPLVLLIRRRWHKIGEDELEAGGAKASLKAQVGLIGGVLRRSRYVNLLILAFLGILTVTTLCEYQYMNVFEKGRSAAQVAALFGALYATVKLFNLVINFFVFNRLVLRLGVRNMALIQPVVYMVAYSFFLLHHGFEAAVFGFFAYQGLLTSVEFNNQNFLFNAMPTRGKAQVRTFIEGLCEPLATAFAGLFLILFAAKLSPETLSLIGLAAAVTALALVLALRAEYVTAMVTNLRGRWLDFSRSPEGRLSSLGRAELEVLRAASQSGERERALPAIALLWKNETAPALEALLAFLEQASPPDQAAAVPLLTTMFEGGTSAVFRRVLIWLERAKARLHPSVLEECGRRSLLSAEDIDSLLRASDPARRAAAAVALWDTWKLDGRLRGVRIANELMHGTDQERIAAIRVVGKSRQPRYANYLLPYLADPSSAVRKGALTSVAQLAGPESGRLLDDVLTAIRRGDVTERRLGLAILARINDTNCIERLARMSDLLTPVEQRRVESLILGIGLRSVPKLTAVLRDTQCALSGKSIAARALGKMAFPQFEALAEELIESRIRQAYEYLCAGWVLAQAPDTDPAFGLLARFYEDSRVPLIDFVLEVLTIGGRLPDFELMASSLRSDNMKDRANAIETIEQGCSRRVFGVLLPLIDSRPASDTIDFYRHTFHQPLPTTAEVLLQSCSNPVQLAAAAAIQALWRMSVAQDRTCPVDRDRLYRIMEEKLVDPSMHMTAEVVFSNLLRKHMPEDPMSKRLNAFEKAHCIRESSDFGSFSIHEIQLMAGCAFEREAKEGDFIHQRGAPCTHVHIVVKGAVRHGNGAGADTVGQGGVLGREALAGAACYAEDAISEDALLLAIPRETIMATAETHPRVAIRLFAQKLGLREPGQPARGDEA